MLKYLADVNEARDIILFYSNKNISEVVYTDVFDQAVSKIGLKTVYTLTDTTQIPPGWKGQTGPINSTIIAEEVPDFKERVFYISGPHSMVTTFENVLLGMGVSNNKIKTDFFPGFA